MNKPYFWRGTASSLFFTIYVNFKSSACSGTGDANSSLLYKSLAENISKPVPNTRLKPFNRVLASFLQGTGYWIAKLKILFQRILPCKYGRPWVVQSPAGPCITWKVVRKGCPWWDGQNDRLPESFAEEAEQVGRYFSRSTGSACRSTSPE